MVRLREQYDAASPLVIGAGNTYEWDFGLEFETDLGDVIPSAAGAVVALKSDVDGAVKVYYSSDGGTTWTDRGTQDQVYADQWFEEVYPMRTGAIRIQFDPGGVVANVEGYVGTL